MDAPLPLEVLSFWPSPTCRGRLSTWRAYIPDRTALPESGALVCLAHKPGIWTVVAEGHDEYGSTYVEVVRCPSGQHA